MGIHGDNQFRIGTVQNFLADTLTFTADDNGHIFQIGLPQILRSGRQGRYANGDAGCCAGRFHTLPVRTMYFCAEYCTHAGPNHLMAIGIGAAFQQHHRNIQRIRSPQNGAQIAWILDAVQQQHTGSRHKVLLLRKPAQEQSTLGALHGGDGLHHVAGNPDHPNLLRHIDFHPVRQDHGIQSGIIFHCFLQQLGSVSSKQACLFSGLFGGEQLLYLLQQGIFPGCNSLFCHSFCTASRE